MRKLKLLLVILLSVLIIPFNVFADEDDKAEESKEVHVYIFKGDGCGFCEAALEWFDEIDDKYGDMFKLYEYETWYNQDNANLMNEVAKVRGEDVQGVPYIIVGDQSWNGFDESNKNEIKNKIKEEYDVEVEKRYDVMQLVDHVPTGEDKDTDDGYTDDIAVTALLVVVVIGVGLGIYSLRKSN